MQRADNVSERRFAQHHHIDIAVRLGVSAGHAQVHSPRRTRHRRMSPADCKADPYSYLRVTTSATHTGFSDPSASSVTAQVI
jgi:hypothetical protein